MCLFRFCFSFEVRHDAPSFFSPLPFSFFFPFSSVFRSCLRVFFVFSFCGRFAGFPLFWLFSLFFRALPISAISKRLTAGHRPVDLSVRRADFRFWSSPVVWAETFNKDGAFPRQFHDVRQHFVEGRGNDAIVCLRFCHV